MRTTSKGFCQLCRGPVESSNFIADRLGLHHRDCHPTAFLDDVPAGYALPDQPDLELPPELVDEVRRKIKATVADFFKTVKFDARYRLAVPVRDLDLRHFARGGIVSGPARLIFITGDGSRPGAVVPLPGNRPVTVLGKRDGDCEPKIEIKMHGIKTFEAARVLRRRL